MPARWATPTWLVGALSPNRIAGTAWTATNDGAGSGLDADLLDGQHGVFYQDATNLTAGMLNPLRYSAIADLGAEGFLGNAAGDLAQNNGTLQATLNADLLDGLNSGNASGNIPISNGTVNTNLNADFLDGQHAAGFATSGHNHWGAIWSGAGVGLQLTSSDNIGLSASTSGNSGRGVYGEATASTGTTYGVLGYNDSNHGFGVYGMANNNNGRNVGVYGRADAEGGYGVAAHHYYEGAGLGVWSWSGDLIRAYAGDYPSTGSFRFGVNNAGATSASAYRFNTPKTYTASFHAREFVSQVDNPPDTVTRDNWTAYISAGAAPYSATLACGVHLPNGATITELHAWVYDNDAAGQVSVSLNRLTITAPLATNYKLAEVWTTVQSTDNQHLSDTTVAGWSVVDNATYSYQITAILSPSATGANIALRRVWIVYTMPEVSF